MTHSILHKVIFAALIVVVFAFASCEKKAPESTRIPIVTYKVLIYDSVEGTAGVEHYSINRLLEIQYDANFDLCYMANNDLANPRVDTFDRSPHWKRGYINRQDFMHRIIFNGDTITIHHNVQNQIGQSGFRYTHGIKQ